MNGSEEIKQVTFRLTRRDGWLKKQILAIPEKDRSYEIREALIYWFKQKELGKV